MSTTPTEREPRRLPHNGNLPPGYAEPDEAACPVCGSFACDHDGDDIREHEEELEENKSNL